MLEHAGAETEDDDGTAPSSNDPSRPVRGPAALGSWLALGVVVAILGTLLLVKVVGDTSLSGTALAVTSPTVFAQVTMVPASVANTVGVSSSTVPVRPPVVVSGAPMLTALVPEGARLPVVLYVGAEYCSFCAAERWPLIIALSRFGSFNKLFDMQSSLVDYAPGTQTFSFHGTTFKSEYVVFRPFEVANDVLGPHGYAPLMKISPDMAEELARFDPSSVYPFVDIANRAVVLQADLSPETLAGLTRDDIAGSLTDPTNAVTRAILVAANELTASICHVDGEQPATVCDSSAVLAANRVLGLAKAS